MAVGHGNEESHSSLSGGSRVSSLTKKVTRGEILVGYSNQFDIIATKQLYSKSKNLKPCQEGIDYSAEDTRGTVTTYLTLNGKLVGTYTYEKATPSNAKLTYVLTNYLGTPVLQTDEHGDIVEMGITDVFGNYVARDQRNDAALHTKAYTGHEFDDVTGLTYAHARYLDTKAHTFISVDPMIYKIPKSYLYDPQQMNSYAYARNSPIVYTDPTGEAIFLPVMAVMGITALVAPWVAAIYEATRPNGNVARAEVYVNLGLNMPGMIGPAVITKGNGGAYGGFASPTTGSPKTSSNTGLAGNNSSISAGRSSVNSSFTNTSTAQSTPEIILSRSRYPESANHAANAQASGQPSTLTLDRLGAPSRRPEAISSTPLRSGYDRDEYPPAMFKEGGFGASVRYVSPRDNRGAGACIAAQCREYPDGTQIELKVID